MLSNTSNTLLSSDYADVPAPLAAIYESYLEQAVTKLGLSLDEALSNLPDVDYYLHVKDAVFAKMRASENKESLAAIVLTDGPVSECLPFLGVPTENGYGPHRRNWVRFFGEIPEGLEVDHLCNNRLCQNVAHMILTTRALNGRRAHFGKEFCQRDHRLSETMTGFGFCGACNAEVKKNRVELLKLGQWVPSRGKATEEECANGHDWTPETEYIRVRGDKTFKECKVCRQDVRKASLANKVLELV
jgi:hypothetical protein